MIIDGGCSAWGRGRGSAGTWIFVFFFSHFTLGKPKTEKSKVAILKSAVSKVAILKCDVGRATLLSLFTLESPLYFHQPTTILSPRWLPQDTTDGPTTTSRSSTGPWSTLLGRGEGGPCAEALPLEKAVGHPPIIFWKSSISRPPRW